MNETQTKRLVKAYIDFSKKIAALQERQDKLLNKLKKYVDNKELEKIRKQLNS